MFIQFLFSFGIIKWSALLTLASFQGSNGVNGLPFFSLSFGEEVNNCWQGYGLRGNVLYHVSCEPLRIFWNDDTTCLTRVLPSTGWIPVFSACSGQHAWYKCRAGCIVISENPQGLATHMVQLKRKRPLNKNRNATKRVISHSFYSLGTCAVFFKRFAISRYCSNLSRNPDLKA